MNIKGIIGTIAGVALISGLTIGGAAWSNQIQDARNASAIAHSIKVADEAAAIQDAADAKADADAKAASDAQAAVDAKAVSDAAAAKQAQDAASAKAASDAAAASAVKVAAPAPVQQPSAATWSPGQAPKGTPLPHHTEQDPNNGNFGKQTYDDPCQYCASRSGSTINGVPECD